MVVWRFWRRFPLDATFAVWFSAGDRDVAGSVFEGEAGGRAVFPGFSCALGNAVDEFIQVVFVQRTVAFYVHFANAGAAVGVRAVEDDVGRVDADGFLDGFPHAVCAFVETQDFRTDDEEGRCAVVDGNGCGAQGVVHVGRGIVACGEAGQVNANGWGDVCGADADVVGVDGGRHGGLLVLQLDIILFGDGPDMVRCEVVFGFVGEMFEHKRCVRGELA